jgi:hypothetical protein
MTGSSYANTACASGSPVKKAPDGPGVPPVSSCGSVITPLSQGVTLTKTVDLPTADVWDTLIYTITVTNVSGEYTFSAYIDDWCDGLENTSAALAPGAVRVYHCTHRFNAGDVAEGGYTNTACVNAYPARSIVPLLQEVPQAAACASAKTVPALHDVAGQVFEDLNADGARDPGEPALEGFAVYADLNGNGAKDAGEPTATSAANGAYTVAVELGKTIIREDVPSGWTCSVPADCAYVVDLPKNNPPVQSRLAHRAADPAGRDFGNWKPAAVSGGVFDDVNGDGIQDEGEGPLAGYTVYADLNGDGAFSALEPSTATGEDGSYVLAGLKPGSYIIRHIAADDQSCTAPAGCSHSVTLTSRQTAPGRNFLDARVLVLGARIVAGSARLTGASGCATGAFSVRVRGARIVRVVFVLDGNRIRVLYKPNSGDTFAFRVEPRRLRIGRHTVRAKVTFAPNSQTHSKTMRLTFRRCAIQLRTPQFTG